MVEFLGRISLLEEVEEVLLVDRNGGHLDVTHTSCRFPSLASGLRNLRKGKSQKIDQPLELKFVG